MRLTPKERVGRYGKEAGGGGIREGVFIRVNWADHVQNVSFLVACLYEVQKSYTVVSPASASASSLNVLGKVFY